jgi:RNA polymerase sigma-70 factor (ECF subfamily)
VHGYVNDYDLAQDLAQETFILVWQKLDFRNESSIGTWIFRIATNTAYANRKRKDF